MIALILFFALAQDTPTPAVPQKHSISGTVREFGSGAPVADATVYLDRPPGKRLETQTDPQGSYTLRDVDSGRYRVTAMGKARDGTRGFGSATTKLVLVGPNQDVNGVDFQLRNRGSISGTITDQNGEPVPQIAVFLIAREYSLGELRYVFASSATTNDSGEYTLRNVEPGHGYLILAEKRVFRLDAISDAPEDPKLRRPAFVPTYYPGTPSAEGAQAITVQSGERREGVDIRLQRSESYCVDGTLDYASTPAGIPRFEIAERQPTSGASGNGVAMFMTSPGGTPGPDGKIRVCDLAPGEYRLTAVQMMGDDMPLYASIALPVTEDVHRISIAAQPHLPMKGELVWFGNPPDQPAASKLTVQLTPLSRAPFQGEFPKLTQTIEIPGEASWGGLIVDDYSVQIRGMPPGTYVKDLIYGGRSILNQPLRIGSASDSTLRVVLAADSGVVKVSVTDKDGNALPDQYVLFLPATASSEAALATAMAIVQTDQSATATSPPLAPGKYLVAAQNFAPDRTPEFMAKLWNNRTHFQEIEIAPKSTMQVTLVSAP
jgi:hypothetical protein